MAETDANSTSTEQAAQPTVEDLQKQIEALSSERDKAIEQSRKWEGRSKSNADKAKKYDELAAQSMTDAERIDAATKRADEAEKKLAEYEAREQHDKDASEVSQKYGVPANLLIAADRKSMEEQAKSILAFAQGQPIAPVFKGDGSASKKPKPTPQDQFAQFFNTMMN